MPARTGPGPGAYGLPTTVGYIDHDITRERNPAYTIRPRLKDMTRALGPGPKYDLKQNQTKYGLGGIPAYSFGQRTQMKGKENVPGPGTYAIEKCPPTKKTPPAYSISPRTELPFHVVGPGPIYQLPTYVGPKNPDKHANPAYSMGGRQEIASHFVSPGPARYNPPNMNAFKQKKPAYIMGARTAILTGKGFGPGPAGYYPGKVCCNKNPGSSFGVRHGEAEIPLILKEDN